MPAPLHRNVRVVGHREFRSARERYFRVHAAVVAAAVFRAQPQVATGERNAGASEAHACGEPLRQRIVDRCLTQLDEVCGMDVFRRLQTEQPCTLELAERLPFRMTRMQPRVVHLPGVEVEAVTDRADGTPLPVTALVVEEYVEAQIAPDRDSVRHA